MPAAEPVTAVAGKRPGSARLSYLEVADEVLGQLPRDQMGGLASAQNLEEGRPDEQGGGLVERDGQRVLPECALDHDTGTIVI